MKTLISRNNLSRNTWIIGLLAVIAAFLILGFNGLNSSEVNAQDKHVVTIYDGGQSKSFATDASTVSEALLRAEIQTDENDLIEPGLDEAINSSSFSINIYRARTVTICDGLDQYTVSTGFRSPEAIARAAGLTIYPEDEFELSRVDDFVSEDLVGIKLSINRATPLNLYLYGSQVPVRTQQNNVADFLAEKGVVLADTDAISPNLDSEITEGMLVSVSRVGTEVVAVNEEIPFDREVINDANEPIGTERVKQAGVLGETLATYEITYHDEQEVGRILLQSVTLKEPENEVVIIGAQALDISGDKMDWMSQAGIAESDWPYVDSIISAESRWRTTVWNTLGSGAYGLCQALPASKMASAGDDYMTNPVTQLKWCSGYAAERYGSWAQAYDFWQIHHWW